MQKIDEQSAETATPSLARRWWNSRGGYRLLREAALMYGLFAVYKLVRAMVRDHQDTALDHARDVMHVERMFGIFNEETLQDLVINQRQIVTFLNAYYLIAHFLVTTVVFAVLYLTRPEGYARARRILFAMTGIALVVHVLYPLAPPRMFPVIGFIDTGTLIGPGAYGNGHAYDGLANQFAAMPSMHFGWSVLIAWAVVRYFRSPKRWIVVVHPFLTLAAIVLTANHYWMDAVIAMIIFGGVFLLDRALFGRRAESAQPAIA
ncbi:MAG: phosphatase PAP2 family protein [Acidimicrobiia bacterium]